MLVLKVVGMLLTIHSEDPNMVKLNVSGCVNKGGKSAGYFITSQHVNGLDNVV